MCPSLEAPPVTNAPVGDAALNIVTLIGRLARPAEERLLPSGDRLLTLEVSVARPGERTESVPVVWFDPRASALDLDVDTAVLVIGRVRRRFYRAAGGTQSRTEVVADRVVPARQTKRVRTALADAAGRLEAVASGDTA
jgi:single-strand DNA-binding protein